MGHVVVDDPGGRRRHRRPPGRHGERVRDRRPPRMVLRAAAPADLSLPAPRSPRGRTACTRSPRSPPDGSSRSRTSICRPIRTARTGSATGSHAPPCSTSSARRVCRRSSGSSTCSPSSPTPAMPVFLTGDFNSPSHLDWTPAVDAVREEVRYPVVWPVSAALADAGFRDSYREVHPDPVAVPGFTWTPPGTLESVPDEVHDRIDWVLVQGPAETLATQLVGEAGGPDVDIERDPYPTDHRGVVSTFRVEAADPAPFAAVGRAQGVRRPGSGRARPRAGLARGAGPRRPGPGSGAGLALASAAASDVTLTFPTATLSPGAHEALLAERERRRAVPKPVLGLRGRDAARACGPRRRSTRSGSRSACGGGPRPGIASTGWACSRPGEARRRTRRTVTRGPAATATTSSTTTRGR